MGPNLDAGGGSTVLGALYEIGQLLSSSLDLDVVLERVMDAVVAVTRAERGFVLLAEPEQELSVAVARNLKREEIEQPGSELSLSLCRRVAETGQAVLIADALADERTAEAGSVMALRIRSVLCAPLRAKDRTIGIVYLEHRMEKARFGERELRLLEAVAGQAAIAIENASLYRDLFHLKAYQDNIFRSVATAIVGLDLHGRVLSVNRAAEEMFGKTESEARGSSYPQLLGEKLSSRMFHRFTRAGNGESSPPLLAVSQDGAHERHLRCWVTPLLSADGAGIGLIFIADDETARVLAERAREQEEAERKRIRDLFGRFVAEPVVAQIVADPSRAQLGGHRREVSVLFADVRDYTTLAEMSSPEQLVETLNRYLALAAETIIEHGGTLDKFMGDGVMAVFNAPLDQPDHAFLAVNAAWQMQQLVHARVEGPGFGVAVNTGEVLAGILGTDRFRNYACVGDATNVTARLQGLARSGEVLLTAATLGLIRDRVSVESLGPLEVKGRAAPIEAYRLLGVTA